MPVDYDEKIEYIFDGIAKVRFDSKIMVSHFATCKFAVDFRRTLKTKGGEKMNRKGVVEAVALYILIASLGAIFVGTVQSGVAKKNWNSIACRASGKSAAVCNAETGFVPRSPRAPSVMVN